MFISDKYFHMENEEKTRIVNSFNVGILHYCRTNKSYLQYKVDNGLWIDDIGAHTFVVPRSVMACASYSVLLRGLNDRVELVESVIDTQSECNDCPYSENCNGQMCFFSMI